MHNIYVNGNLIQTQTNNLQQLLIEQGFSDSSPVATAVNGKFIAKTQRQDYELKSNDKVEIVAPMQGG